MKRATDQRLAERRYERELGRAEGRAEIAELIVSALWPLLEQKIKEVAAQIVDIHENQKHD